MKIRHSTHGFTLIEILLSFALIAVIAGVGVPIYQALQNRNDLDIAANSIVQSLRRAQVLSRAMDGDTAWGVHVEAESITLFRGVSYAARNSGFDEVFDMPSIITPSGVLEVVFSKFSGNPQTTGTVTLTSNANETRAITINAKGMVSF